MQIFSDVFVTEELYGCNRREFPWMPDLLLAPANGLAVVKKIRGRDPVRWVSLDRLEGTHRLEGVFVANGPSIRPGKQIVNAHIADLAPTLLAALGERVPQDMEGRVIRELFNQPVTVEYEPPRAREETEAPVLSKQQLEEVAERLGDLGYLD
jgi:predicted AlkP superfamily phosphohydrolase/phosphomutase